MFEIECKLPVKDYEELTGTLEENGFVFEKYLKESDIYFASPVVDFVKTGEALRIRSTENLLTNEKVSYVTYKGPKINSTVKARKELETEVGDESVFEDVLLSLGYKKVAPVVKKRKYFTNKEADMTACADYIDQLGAFLELELIVKSEEDKNTAQSRIEEMLNKLGHSIEETTKVSYLGMLLKIIDE